MLTKILLTALVILGCYLFLRHKRARPALPRPGTEPSAIARSPDRSIRSLALGLCLLALAASAAYLGYRWWDDSRLLNIRVINPSTGESVEYQAHKGDIRGRSFTTRFGQKILVAESERLEISEAD